MAKGEMSRRLIPTQLQHLEWSCRHAREHDRSIIQVEVNTLDELLRHYRETPPLDAHGFDNA